MIPVFIQFILQALSQILYLLCRNFNYVIQRTIVYNFNITHYRRWNGEKAKVYNFAIVIVLCENDCIVPYLSTISQL